MSDVVKDVGAIWYRLFDHKAFVNGEIQFTLREYEQKRKDKEVEDLFSILETVTDVRDAQINRFKKSSDYLPQANVEISQAINLCDQIIDFEEKHREDRTLDETRKIRKEEYEKFLNNLTESYSAIDDNIAKKDKELTNFYSDLKDKLEIRP